MTDDMQPWPTLTDFLDAGGDPSLAWGNDWESLIAFLVAELERFTPTTRQRRATIYEIWSRESLEDSNRTRTPGHENTPAQHFDICRLCAWEGELCADPALEARVRALIPQAMRDYENEQRDLWRRPYPLVVKACPDAQHWNCSACGAAFEPEAEAIVVTDREGHSHLESEIEYCRDCVAMALAAYDAGRVQ